MKKRLQLKSLILILVVALAMLGATVFFVLSSRQPSTSTDPYNPPVFDKDDEWNNNESTDPVDTPSETDPVETEPSETDPVETEPPETDPVETDPPVDEPTDRSIEELRELVPDYFMDHSFKGIEMYAKKAEDGTLLCAVMPGTNRLKTFEEVKSLIYITPTEMKSIFDECETDLTEVTIVSLEQEEYNINTEDRETLHSIFEAKVVDGQIDSQADIDRQAVQYVEELIAALPGKENIKVEDKERVADVRSAFNALTIDQKAIISDDAANKLVVLEQTITKLEKAAEDAKAREEEERLKREEEERKKQEEERKAAEEAAKKHLPGSLTATATKQGGCRCIKCQDCEYTVKQNFNYVSNSVGSKFNGKYCFIDGDFYLIEKKTAKGEFYDNLKAQNPDGPKKYEELYANGKLIGYLGDGKVQELNYDVYTLGASSSGPNVQLPAGKSHHTEAWQSAEQLVWKY